MEDLARQVIDWIAIHPHWANFVVFLIACGESVALFGLIVPGTVAMFLIGALVAVGALDLWITLMVSILGAIAGDWGSYYFGYYFQDRVHTLWPFNRYPGLLAKGMDFFRRYGGKSVFIGRFVGPVRPVIPLVAGLMNMRPVPFMLANVLSGLIWGPVYLFPGIVFGTSLELAAEVTTRLGLILVLLLGFVWGVVWVIRLLFKQLHGRSGAWLNWLLGWAKAHPRVGEAAAALVDPLHPEARGLAVFASLLLIAILAFMGVLGALMNSHGVAGGVVLNAFQELRSPLADYLMLWALRLADPWVLGSVAAAFGLMLWVRRDWHGLRHGLAAGVFAVLVPWILQRLLRVSGPGYHGKVQVHGSFPSDVVVHATLLYGFIAVAMARGVSDERRWMPYAVAGFLVTLVGLARLYLGVNWPADVLGGMALGLAWLAALGIGYRRRIASEAIHWRPMLGVMGGAFLIAYGAVGAVRGDRELARYRLHPETHTLTVETWRAGGWQTLPSTRQDLRVQVRHPLTLQYAGDLAAFKTRLAGVGWQAAPMIDGGNWLKLFSPSLGIEQLPLLPLVHEGQHESLTLVRDGPEGRDVLRLWEGHVRLLPGNIPVWVGNVNRLQRHWVFQGLMTYLGAGPDFSEPLKNLLTDLPGERQLTVAGEPVLLW
ncbi:MAG: VTT domain-containing protein [Pseudomonadota bacterium]